jgi:hypothetical protein
MINGAVVHGHSRQQTVVATSSAEAEYYAMASAAVDLLGLRSMLEECSLQWEARLRCDSTSGRALAVRQGLGRVRHIDIKMLWLQDVIAKSILTVAWVGSAENLADIGTKALLKERHEFLVRKIGLHEQPGEIALLEASTELCRVNADIEVGERLVAAQPWVRTPSWTLLTAFVLTWLCGLVCGWKCTKCCSRRQSASQQPATANKRTQSPVTYTAVRKVSHPRFQPLTEREQGTWSDD